MPSIATTATSGFDTLDDLLGGVFWGDNVVLRATTPRVDLERIVNGFTAADGYTARGAIYFTDAGETEAGIEHRVIVDGDVDDAIATALALGREIGVGGLIVFDDLALLVQRLGERDAQRFFVRVCPTLLRVGSVAVWRLGSGVPVAIAEEIARVTQIVLTVEGERLIVTKAEARPPDTVGVTLRLQDGVGGTVMERVDDASRLGASLMALRAQRGLTQSQLSRLAGVSPSAMSQAERGQRGLSIGTLIRLASALGVTLDELVLGQSTLGYRIRGRTAPHRGGASRVALVDAANGPYRLYEFRLDPGAHGSPPTHARGSELVLLGRGLLMITLADGSTPVIREGEALLANGVAVTDWRNLAEDQAVGFWVEV